VPANLQHMNLTRWLDCAYLDSSFPLPLDQAFTTATAVREGVSKDSLVRLHASGHLRRPIRGVYVAAQLGDSITLRASCLALVMPPDAVVCDRHAGWLLGAEMVLAPNEHLDLQPLSIFRPSDRGRLRNGLADSGERNLLSRDVTEIHGLRVTTPIRTAWDLGRLQKRDRALAGLDAMLRLGQFSKDELVAGVERFRGMRWVTQLRTLAPLSDARAESPGESALRLRWLDCPLPPPTPQVEVWQDGRLIARLDLANEDLMLAVEYDGREWHTTDQQRDRDRIRREVLHDEHGWTIRAVTAVNVYGPRQDIHDVLMAAAHAARLRRGRRIA
jgi:hypothetical protein